MSSNPYQPPGAEVADAPDSSPPRPRSVHLACQLVLASFALGLVTLVPGVDVTRPDDPAVHWAVTLVVVLVFGAITVWLTYATHQRRNWARWALLGYLIFGWFLSAGELPSDLERAPLVGLLGVGAAVIELVAVWFLFTGAGAKWFSGRQAAASAEA